METKLDVIANNLANVNTPGFRASIDAFRSVPLQGEGLATRTFVVNSTAGTDFTPGVMQQTGRALDVALDGKGWIAVALVVMIVSFAFSITSLGMLVAGVARTYAQANALANILMYSIAALGGAWWPIEIVPSWMQQLARLTRSSSREVKPSPVPRGGV